jgi:Tol biopolymer transport system component
MKKDGGLKVMAKKFAPLVFAVLCVCAAALTLPTPGSDQTSSIKRLTFSGNDVVKHPCLSRDGRLMLYTAEMKEGEKTKRAIRLLDIQSGEGKEIFRDGAQKAPTPHEDADLVVGTKPALLSGDGKTAVFALSLGDSSNQLADHYLGVAETEGTGFTVTSFAIEALKDKDAQSLDLDSDNWERVSNYAVSHDGQRIACVVKGHLGPQRLGHASGIILIDVPNQIPRTLMAPDFSEGVWQWTSFPRRPLTGGAWAFGLSENGEKVLFGAQSSEDINNYDLYITEWESGETRRVTDFQDRWISLADISADGKKIVFFYTGKQKQGIGTYFINSDGTGLKQIESDAAPRVEFLDLSGDGRYIVFKHIYQGMILDLLDNTERVAYSASTEGYVEGITPMEFPPYPSFWNPKIMSFNGGIALLVGPPSGKNTSEIYLLHIGQE